MTQTPAQPRAEIGARLGTSQLSLHYQVAMPHPETHLFEVALAIRGWSVPTLDLKMPVWTPGSYLVREYARHVQDFVAQSAVGDQIDPVPWRKVAKNHWQVGTIAQPTPDILVIRYRVYANELTVRTNHLDLTHGYFNGSALFCYLPDRRDQPMAVTIVPPCSDWDIATPLDPLSLQHRDQFAWAEQPLAQTIAASPQAPRSGTAQTFYAPNFDILVDSPFEVGIHDRYTFQVAQKKHELVVWGKGNFAPEPALADIHRIIETEAELFGGLPYDRYLFLLHLAPTNLGGLEHRNSCSLIYNRFGFNKTESYQRFLQLVAHEFFHLWNVKRLRPKALETIDYDRENYTPSLWFCEGATSYYDLVIPMRAGLYNADTFLTHLSKDITRLQTTPGRLVQPLRESSFDAWIKLYRPDANSPNSRISYYLKGELVVLLLDLLIRDRHDNQRSFDDVLRALWQTFGQPERGYTPEQLQATIAEVAGCDLTSFYEQYLDGTQELPWAEFLHPFGITLEAETSELPTLGITLKSEAGREIIQTVDFNSAAQRAGLNVGDELLALDGFRITADQFNDRLRDYQPGDPVTLSIFRQDQLLNLTAVFAPSQPTRYLLRPMDQITPQQARRFSGWLGAFR